MTKRLLFPFSTKNPKSCLPLIFGHDDDEKEAMKIAEIIKENQYDYSSELFHLVYGSLGMNSIE